MNEDRCEHCGRRDERLGIEVLKEEVRESWARIAYLERSERVSSDDLDGTTRAYAENVAAVRVEMARLTRPGCRLLMCDDGPGPDERRYFELGDGVYESGYMTDGILCVPVDLVKELALLPDRATPSPSFGLPVTVRQIVAEAVAAGGLRRVLERRERERDELRDKLFAVCEHARRFQNADGESEILSIIDCPHNEPLHHHHDGCPACETSPEKGV